MRGNSPLLHATTTLNGSSKRLLANKINKNPKAPKKKSVLKSLGWDRIVTGLFFVFAWLNGQISGKTLLLILFVLRLMGFIKKRVENNERLIKVFSTFSKFLQAVRLFLFRVLVVSILVLVITGACYVLYSVGVKRPSPVESMLIIEYWFWSGDVFIQNAALTTSATKFALVDSLVVLITIRLSWFKSVTPYLETAITVQDFVRSLSYISLGVTDGSENKWYLFFAVLLSIIPFIFIYLARYSPEEIRAFIWRLTHPDPRTIDYSFYHLFMAFAPLRLLTGPPFDDIIRKFIKWIGAGAYADSIVGFLALVVVLNLFYRIYLLFIKRQ